MRQWQFEKKDLEETPSAKDGVDRDTEERYRKEGVRFIMDVGNALKLSPFPTLATAAVFFHRFYMYHSFREFQRHLTALSCLFLAGKVEETPKKCRDLVQVARDKLSDHHFAFFGRDPREEIMSVERVLLQTIKFDLHVEHPYQFLLKYAKVFKIDRQRTQQVVQMAWTFVNDSLCTTLCLQWEPEIVAIAFMYLSSRLSKVEISDWEGRQGVKGEQWWDQFVAHMDMELLEGPKNICHQVLDLYSASGGKASKTPVTNTPTPTTARSTPLSTTPTVAPTTTRPGRHRGTPTTSAAGVHQQVPVLGSATPVPLSQGVPPPSFPPPQLLTNNFGYTQHTPPPGMPPFPPPPPQNFSYPPPGFRPRTPSTPSGYPPQPTSAPMYPNYGHR